MKVVDIAGVVITTRVAGIRMAGVVMVVNADSLHSCEPLLKSAPIVVDDYAAHSIRDYLAAAKFLSTEPFRNKLNRMTSVT